MASTPQVQPLAEIMAELEPATSAQTSLIQKKQAGLGAKYGAQVAGLDAAKANTFNTINNQATGRGMAFSGIPLDEQSVYLSEKYLPARAGLVMQENEESMALEGDLADIYSANYQNAFNTQKGQKSDLNTWNMQEMQNQFSASEAEKDRTFKANQAAQDRAIQQAQLNKEDEVMTPYEAAFSVISNAVAGGRDISANVFQNARDAYRLSGGDTSQFATDFWKYVPADQQTGDKWKTYYYG